MRSWRERRSGGGCLTQETLPLSTLHRSSLKVLPFLLMLFMMLFTDAALSQVELSLPDLRAAPGGSVVVPVLISDGSEITAIQFKLSFDSTQLAIVDDRSVLKGESLVDHSVGFNRQPEELTVVVFSGSLTTLKPGNGSVVQVVFEVDGSAAEDSTTVLQLDEILASDEVGGAVSVTALDGALTISSEHNNPQEGQNRLVFPQIGNGEFAGGSFALTLVFLNRTGALTPGRIRLFKSDGTPFPVTLTSGVTRSVFDFNVPAGGSVFLKTDGTGELSAGYAVLSATGPLGGTLLFAIRDGTGKGITEAGVAASPIQTRFSIPVIFEEGGADTGVALANLADGNAEITLVLKNRPGSEIEQTTLELLPGEHLPRFVTQLFDTLADLASFEGSVVITASQPISAIALKQEGALLTTFPVIVLE